MNEANIYLVDNASLNELKIIDNFVSFIWTDRYNDYGDFELVIPEEDFDPNLYKKERLIAINDNDRYMIIETITIDDIKESGRENKITYTIKGRGIESLLERRVVEKPYMVNISGDPLPDVTTMSNLGNDISNLIFSYFYNNRDLSLRTSVFEYRSPDNQAPEGGTYGQVNHVPSDLSYRIKNSGYNYMGQTVGQAVWDLCKYTEPITSWPSSWSGKWPDESGSGVKKFNLSFRMYKDEIYMGNGEYRDKLYLVLYGGVDRSYSQSVNPVVEFSEFMDNIGGYSYSDSAVDWKNSAVVRANFVTQHMVPKMNDDGSVQTDSSGNVVWDTYKDKDGVEHYKYEYEDNYIYQNVKTNPPDGGWVDPNIDNTKYNKTIDYRCLFVDSNIERRKIDSDGNLTDDLYTQTEFTNMMKQAGYEALYDYQSKPTYSVELLDFGNYRYGRDYFLGDIVAVKLSNGVMTKARVVEVIRSWDNTGYSIYPRFDLIQD